VLTVDWSGREAQEAAEPATPATVMEEAAGEDAAGAPGAMEERTLYSALRRVQGRPSEVALFLRRQGFEARVVGSTVRVRNADPEVVMRALAGRPDGPVRIEVVP
jgi:hypothetical protein